MKQFKSYTIKEFVDQLSKKIPVPGGGSSAALVGSIGAGLISMVANYSLGKSQSASIDKRIKAILKESEKIRKQLMDCVDLDAKAYLKVVACRQKTSKEKKVALKEARSIPMEVCRLSYKAIELTPFLVKNGNKNLISDIQVAIELLLAAHTSARINVKINE